MVVPVVPNFESTQGTGSSVTIPTPVGSGLIVGYIFSMTQPLTGYGEFEFNNVSQLELQGWTIRGFGPAFLSPFETYAYMMTKPRNNPGSSTFSFDGSTSYIVGSANFDLSSEFHTPAITNTASFGTDYLGDDPYYNPYPFGGSERHIGVLFGDARSPSGLSSLSVTSTAPGVLIDYQDETTLSSPSGHKTLAWSTDTGNTGYYMELEYIGASGIAIALLLVENDNTPPPILSSFVKKFPQQTNNLDLFAGSQESPGDTDGPALDDAQFYGLKDIAYTWDSVQRSGLNLGNRFYVMDDQKLKMIHVCDDNIVQIPLANFLSRYPSNLNPFYYPDEAFLFTSEIAVNKAKNKLYGIRGGLFDSVCGIQEWDINIDLSTFTSDPPGTPPGQNTLPITFNSMLVPATLTHYQFQSLCMDNEDNLYYVEWDNISYKVKKRTSLGVTTTLYDFGATLPSHGSIATTTPVGIGWNPIDNKIYCNYVTVDSYSYPYIATIHFGRFSSSYVFEELATLVIDPAYSLYIRSPLFTQDGSVWYLLEEEVFDEPGSINFDSLRKLNMETGQVDLIFSSSQPTVQSISIWPYKAHGVLTSEYVNPTQNEVHLFRPNGTSLNVDIYSAKHYYMAFGLIYSGTGHWTSPDFDLSVVLGDSGFFWRAG